MATIEVPSAGDRPTVTPAQRVQPVVRVQVRHAVHRYADRVALNGVDLDLECGEIFGLLGRNGAGKTTLMKAICGRMTLDRGTVRVDGGDPRADRKVRRRIGFVPQDIALYSYLTVAENLAIFARLAGVRSGQMKAAIGEALERTGLVDHSAVLGRALSGGFQRRVNICASILHKPDLLVLDEPTVGIDVDARAAIHRLLHDLRGAGATIVLCTHDLEQAQGICDRVAILAAGRVIVDGRPEELIARQFAGQLELTAVLGNVDAAQTSALHQSGLHPAPAPGSWVALVAADALDLQAFSQRLATHAIAIRELRVRQPDLTTVFLAALRRHDQPAGADMSRPS